MGLQWIIITYNCIFGFSNLYKWWRWTWPYDYRRRIGCRTWWNVWTTRWRSSRFRRFYGGYPGARLHNHLLEHADALKYLSTTKQSPALRGWHNGSDCRSLSDWCRLRQPNWSHSCNLNGVSWSHNFRNYRLSYLYGLHGFRWWHELCSLELRPSIREIGTFCNSSQWLSVHWLVSLCGQFFSCRWSHYGSFFNNQSRNAVSRYG